MFGRDPVTPFAKLLEPTPRYWGDRGGQLKMDLLKKLYLVTAENIKQAKERRDPANHTEVRPTFKVNDQVLVRDVTSGAFAPRYTPHNRVVAVHGPNRIVITDEKGNESVRRASHLKHCDTKTKFASMVPENKEYEEFGRSTKLLIHPKDIPELHFPEENNTNTTEQVVINNINESIVDVAAKRHETGEILPELRVDNDNNSVAGYKVKSVDKQAEISPVKRDIQAHSNNGEPHIGNWFSFSVTGMSKLSNALKEGMFGQKGGCPTDMAKHLRSGAEDEGFTFFL